MLIYPVDSAIQLLDNRGLNCKMESKVKREKKCYEPSLIIRTNKPVKISAKINYTNTNMKYCHDRRRLLPQ